MNTKKELLSFVTAVAITASAFTGLVIPASAEGESVNADLNFNAATTPVQPSAQATADATTALDDPAVTEAPTAVPTVPAQPAENGISYKGGKVYITYNKEVKNAKLIVAKYEGNKLIGLKTNDVDLINGTVSVSAQVADGDKLMVWDGINTIMPLVEAVEYVQPTIDPSLIKYTLDFENVEDSKVAEGWVGQTGRLSLQTDSSNTKISKYVRQATESSDGGVRNSTYKLPDDAASIDNDNYAVLEFDMNMSMNGGSRVSQLGFMGTGAGSHDALKSGKSAVSYGGTDFVLLFTQAHDGSLYINNGSLGDQVAKDGEVKNNVNNKWTHVTAVLNFNEGKKSVFVIITSLDGKTEYYRGNAPMGETVDSIQYLMLSSTRNGRGSVSVDNIVVRGLSEAVDVVETYYTVSYEVDGVSSNESVKENEFVTKIPATVKTGYLFKGWKVNDSEDAPISTDDLKRLPITAATKFTAVFEEDPDYIEPMTSLNLTVPDNGLLLMGESDTDFASNPIALSVVGELGSDLYLNPDSRVKDFAVKWSFDGFRTIVANNEPTGDIKENEYCDSYGKVVYDEQNPTVADFTLANQVQNYYGRVKAEVTYNGKTMTIEKPLAVIANTASHPSNQLLPKAGYVSDFTPYENGMVGYKAVTSEDNRNAKDSATGDWAAYGGNDGRGLYIAKDEDGTKFLKLKSTGTNSSSFAVNNIGTAPAGQVVVTQDIRFYNSNSSILYKTANPVTWNDNAVSFDLKFENDALSLNGTKIMEAKANTWYNATIIADVTSQTCYAIVKEGEDGTPVTSEVVKFTNAGSTAPVYLCYRTPDNSQGEIDFNNVKVYVPEVSDAGLTTTLDNSTVTIPENDTAATANLTVSAKSTEGYDIIGKAAWSVVDKPEGMMITADVADSHKAVLSVTKDAQPGNYNIRVALNGETKDIPVTIKGTKDSLGFTKLSKYIEIPYAGDENAVEEYSAQVVNKDGEPYDDKEVEYSIYDANNQTKLTTLPEGITFNAETATLTVTSAAKATVLYIRANSTNSANEPLERAVKINIHGLSFDFGTDAVNATASGYTAVAADSVYDDNSGFGIASGTPTSGGTVSATDADADNLNGNFTFYAKVKPGKVYDVTVNYKGTAVSEYVNADLTGVPFAEVKIKAATKYEIPVVDDVLDLRFTNAEVSSIVIVPQADKTPGEKPNVYTVGDSTMANNGSWAYTLSSKLSQYTDLASIVTLTNNGRGGRNLGSYYTGGELRDRVLKAIKPGDYVIIGNMGTNGMGSYFEESFNYYIDACEAMGAKVILNSYSPHGVVAGYEKGYDAILNKFNSYRQDAYDAIVRSIYTERSDVNGAKYDPNVIGFIDIGHMADAAFNAYVEDYAANNYESKNAAAQAIIKCFGDHNHYSDGPLACQLMLEGYGDGADAKGIVKTLVPILTADLAE